MSTVSIYMVDNRNKKNAIENREFPIFLHSRNLVVYPFISVELDRRERSNVWIKVSIGIEAKLEKNL